MNVSRSVLFGFISSSCFANSFNRYLQKSPSLVLSRVCLKPSLKKIPSIWKKRGDICFQPSELKNNKMFTEFMTKILVDLFYTTIYTVCIYSINIFEACMLPQKPSIHLYSCKNYITLNIASYIMSILSGVGHASTVSFHIKTSNW